METIETTEIELPSGKGDVLKQEEARNLMMQIAGQLRRSLCDVEDALQSLSLEMERESNPVLDKNLAVLEKRFYEILRLTENLSDGAVAKNEEPYLEDLDIVELCRQVMDDVRPYGQYKFLNMKFRSDIRRRVIMAVDKKRIRQLLLNLLSNSMKFTPSGGTIIMEVQLSAQNVWIRVLDTGSGTSADMADTLYTRYQQSPWCMEPYPHGLKLGLAICQQIARDHGGILLVSKLDHGGTSVAVTLPVRKKKGQDMHTYIGFDKTGYEDRGFDPVRVELSTFLPVEAFRVQLPPTEETSHPT